MIKCREMFCKSNFWDKDTCQPKLYEHKNSIGWDEKVVVLSFEQYKVNLEEAFLAGQNSCQLCDLLPDFLNFEDWFKEGKC